VGTALRGGSSFCANLSIQGVSFTLTPSKIVSEVAENEKRPQALEFEVLEGTSEVQQ
jgi:hypothetical protein